ncbi:glycoside hydrolase family 48 protein [Streptomyces sp. NPDC051320]|uniref:glycoside hydrolase family 48 protein n=1 Tax=Streptomyces sp. NPDC051320 TaxID=3154644 RepID=UPI0034164C22
MVALGMGQGLAHAAPDQATDDAAAVGTAAADDTYTQAFLTQYGKIKDAGNGYFSADGIPYHCAETLIVEAPDHGHQTTSEAMSFWMWLEAAYGRVTGDWDPFNNAWAVAEKSLIPADVDQPSNDSYNASSPATYAPEAPEPSAYPTALDSSVSTGSDPIAGELASSYGTKDIYGMHWLMDVDNIYGYGNKPGSGGENGPGAGPSFINSYQRGAQESVWETIPQPTTDLFKYGGTNGYLDLFVKDSAYSKQWKYTNAPDADARAVQAAYWAYTWAKAQGKEGQIAGSVAKAARMGDYLRYAMFDKYFKQIGDCTSPTGCSAGSGRSAQHYLLSWYYAWGGAQPGGGWAWRIGDGASHQGYQNPLAAWALSNVPVLTPKSATAKGDWLKSLTRQLEFLCWLQSSEGALAGGCTNSWEGRYGTPPAGTPTFYGMAYDWEPVYHDPPSNNWFGFQAWGVERIAEYYYVTGNATAETILRKWVAWASSETTVGADGSYSFPSNLSWTGKPDTWNATSPGANAGLHVSVVDYSNDVGVGASYVKTLTYYAARAKDVDAAALAKSLLDAMALNGDAKGIAVPETRTDYSRFKDEVYVPTGWKGTMPNGDPVEPGVTFIGMRSWYKDDPDWPKVQAYLDGGSAPSFTYHRFWAQADLALAFATYAELLVDGGDNGGGSTDTRPPSVPENLAVGTVTSSSVALSWSVSTDDTGVTAYDVFRSGTKVGSATSTSYADTGLTAATAYSYTVSARDAAGNSSALSAAVTATTKSGGGTGGGAVKVQYKNNDQNATDNQIRPGLVVVNTSSAPVDLSKLTLRYWFSSEAGASSFGTWCDYAALGSGSITHKVVAAGGSLTGAGYYLQVGFSSGSLAAGASTGDIQLRLSKTDWSNFNEADDYSHGTNTAYADALKVTAYVGSTLAWGTEPT